MTGRVETCQIDIFLFYAPIMAGSHTIRQNMIARYGLGPPITLPYLPSSQNGSVANGRTYQMGRYREEHGYPRSASIKKNRISSSQTHDKWITP